MVGLAAASCFATASDFSTCSAGVILSFADENVAAILPSGVTTNVVRSVKSWSISTSSGVFQAGA